ncbi:carbohydrate ABC transporter permease [Ruminococcaceae bacterium OttesenSCG-928-L11]|nr:carbohydrate ABC transporter permease [Ruminococcaceae bacterium OttesenSCG-928-L11]
MMSKSISRTQSLGGAVFDVCNHIFLALLSLTMLYPFLNELMKSFSNNDAVLAGQVGLWPKGFHTRGYELVFQNPLFASSLRNTVFITLVGTALTVVLVLLTAFPLSRKGLPGRKFIFLYFLFTMLFSGGMIPTFLTIRNLGLIDSLWALILPGAMNVYNMILAKSYMEQLPESVVEAARIDGCHDVGVLWRIIVPMAKPVIAVVALFSAVSFWNTYMSGILYINSTSNYPLQVYVRQMVYGDRNVLDEMVRSSIDAQYSSEFGSEVVKSAVLITTMLPIIVVYPFLQKYFTSGITLGAVKG